MFVSVGRKPRAFGSPTGPLRSVSGLSVVVLAAALASMIVACGGGNDSGAPSVAGTGPLSPELIRAQQFVEDQVTMNSKPHGESTCSARFVRHELDHITSPRGAVEAMVDGTGAGVYADDLDDDGRVDIVLPNLSGETSVFWNTTAAGQPPTFDRATLTEGRFRQAVAADIDGDGDRDLLLSTAIGPPISFINAGDRTFSRQEFRTRAVTFSMAPGDLDGDGTIEIVTGSYNAELTQNRDNRALTGVDVGVAVHRPTADTLLSGVDHEFLTDSAQALATVIVDVNGDGLEDIVVGNDLGTPDRIWLGDADVPGVAGLTATELFDVTSLSTMSIDVADIDNDGDADFLSTDMAPLPDESPELWAPVAADIEQARIDDIQQPRNVVQLADGAGFEEQAINMGVAATGWSWTGLLGDLDDDGLLDLYVVNGMQALGIFDDLPDGKLIEPNQAFRQENGQFVLRPAWGLDAVDGGRGMAQADLDGDGDLDIVINNLGSAATLWENQVCADGDENPARSLVIEPIWTGVQNLDALGTTVMVDDGDDTRTRSITGTRGYISTSATQAHVGLGADGPATVDVTVRWPDGGTTHIADAAVDTTIRIVRDGPPIDSLAGEAP